MSANDIITTAGDPFKWNEHVLLARLIYKRFGNDANAAAAAWRRMLQNSATVADLMRLVNDRENPRT